MKTRILLFVLMPLLGCGAWAAKDTCFECHLVMEGMSLKFTNDVHFAKEVSCASCHGGDPNEPDQNISMNASRGFKVRVQRQGVPEFCGNCHSDAAFMGKYREQPVVDQLAEYKNGVHGKLLAAGRKRAAECGDCHGVHNTRPVSDPQSTASPQRVSKTCAKCHEDTAEVYAGSRHARLFNTARRPGCTACHSSHDTEPASASMLTGSTSVCVKCHRAGSRPARVADELASFMANLESAGPESKDALARARVAVHAMSLPALRRAVDTAPPSSPTNEQAGGSPAPAGVGSGIQASQ